MMARLDQRFRLALHQTFRESPDNFFSAGIRRVAAGCCSGALSAEFVVKAQSPLRLAGNVAPGWRDDKRLSRKALLQVPYPRCAPLSASFKGNKSANSGHSATRGAPRLGMQSELSLGAINGFGDWSRASGLAFVEILYRLLGVTDALLHLSGNLF